GLNLFRQCGPGAVVLVAFHAGFDEGDTGPAILEVGVFAAIAGKFFTGLPFAHVGLEATMQPREGVVKRLRMTRRNRRLGHQVGGQVLRQKTVAASDRAAPINAVGLVRQVNREALWFLLLPAERALGAGDDQAEIVFVA